MPNVGWAERLRARLARRGFATAGSWAEAAGGWPVVVGSRGAAFAPMGRLGAAVVLDAHDEAYREERSPHFDASLVVAERASRDGAPCLFTSATPTVSQVTNCAVVEPARNLERQGWPMLHVIDRRGADPRTGLYSEELVRVARSARGRPVRGGVDTVAAGPGCSPVPTAGSWPGASGAGIRWARTPGAWCAGGAGPSDR